MKNYNIHFSVFDSLWKKPGAAGVTWAAMVLETDPTGILCFVCIFGFVLFDLEIKKKLVDNEGIVVNHDNKSL